MHERGSLDPARLAELLDIDPVDVPAAVTGAAFIDPDTGQLTPRSTYLSGNVRVKLAAAETAADDDTYTPNVDALREVLPADLNWDDISAQLGVTWVTPEEIKGFIDHTFGPLAEQVADRAMVHGADPMLTRHVTSAQKLHRGDAWVFTRSGGPVDGSYAMSAAIHLARTMPPPRPKLHVAGG